MNFRLRILQLLLLCLLPVAAAEAQDAAAVASRLRTTFPGMPANAMVEATVVAGIYVMRVPGFTGCPVYTDERVTMVANNGRRGWVSLPSNQPLDEARSRELVARVYGALPARLVPAGVGSDSGMVLVSGVDCQPSAVTEAGLGLRKVGYRILPAALDPANLPAARAAACAPDGAAAWQAIRQGKAPRAAECSVDAAALKDLSCMRGGGLSRRPSGPQHGRPALQGPARAPFRPADPLHRTLVRRTARAPRCLRRTGAGQLRQAVEIPRQLPRRLRALHLPMPDRHEPGDQPPERTAPQSGVAA